MIEIYAPEHAQQITQQCAEWERARRAAPLVSLCFAEEINGVPVSSTYFDEAAALRMKSSFRGLTCCQEMDPVVPWWTFDEHDPFCEGKPWYHPHPGIRLDRLCKPSHGRIMRAVLTAAGKASAIGALDLDTLRDGLLDPAAFDGQFLGAGSEGNVYVYTIGGQRFAVKLFDAEGLRRTNEESQKWRMHFSAPDFIGKIGFTDRVLEAVRGFPASSYTLSSLAEYAASPKYIITELGPRVSVDDLCRSVGLVVRRPSEPDAPAAAQCLLHEHGIRLEDVRRLVFELRELDDYASILAFNKVGFIGARPASLYCDFAFSNFLVRGFDRSVRRFDLVLIDQGAAPVASSTDPCFREFERWRFARRVFDILVRRPRHRAFFEREGIQRPFLSGAE